MKACRLTILVPFILIACATESETRYDPLQEYEELDATTVLEAPSPVPGNFAPERLYQVVRGKYLVELIGCGACHTDGALEGVPNLTGHSPGRALVSRIRVRSMRRIQGSSIRRI